jgi:recombinational DNA repair ATPase RecF
LARQRQNLDDDLQVKEKQLSELATQLQEQRSEVARKLQQVEVGHKLLLKKQGLLEENIASKMA